MSTWDDAADGYLAMVSDPAQGFNHLAADVALELLGPAVAGWSVLDIGCGEGFFARRLARMGASVIGIDPTRTLLDAALEAERQEPFGIRYHLDTAEQLAFVATASIDLAVALLSLHHVNALGAALASLHRALRPSGRSVNRRSAPMHRPSGGRAGCRPMAIRCGPWATVPRFLALRDCSAPR